MDAHAWDERYAAADMVWGAPPNPVVVEYTTALPAGRALDVGCGEGRHAIWLATRGWSVTGIDFSQVGIDKARSIAARAPRSVAARLRFVCGDVTDPTEPPFGDDHDLVVVAYLHLRADERRRVLANAARTLVPGGTMVVLGHDASNPRFGTGGPQDPEILYTADDLVDDLSGLVTPTVARTEPRETPDGRAVDALFVGTR